MKRNLGIIKAIVCINFLVLCGPVQADMYSFDVFTANGAYGDNPGFNVWVDVRDGGTATTAIFEFHNDSAFSCSITQIYFDDGALLGIGSLENGPGTDFGTGEVTPGPDNLPGWDLLNPDFEATQEFSIGPFPEMIANGINPGEMVRVTFQLKSDLTMQNVLNDIDSGALRVGVHIQSFPDGFSESAIMIPEPATVGMMGLFAGLGFAVRRFRM